MKISQKRAIFYHERDRKLAKLEQMGLLKEYREYNKGKVNHTISAFCKRKGITL